MGKALTFGKKFKKMPKYSVVEINILTHIFKIRINEKHFYGSQAPNILLPGLSGVSSRSALVQGQGAGSWVGSVNLASISMGRSWAPFLGKYLLRVCI